MYCFIIHFHWDSQRHKVMRWFHIFSGPLIHEWSLPAVIWERRVWELELIPVVRMALLWTLWTGEVMRCSHWAWGLRWSSWAGSWLTTWNLGSIRISVSHLTLFTEGFIVHLLGVMNGYCHSPPAAPHTLHHPVHFFLVLLDTMWTLPVLGKPSDSFIQVKCASCWAGFGLCSASLLLELKRGLYIVEGHLWSLPEWKPKKAEWVLSLWQPRTCCATSIQWTHSEVLLVNLQMSYFYVQLNVYVEKKRKHKHCICGSL